MTESLAPERDIPAPQYEIVEQTMSTEKVDQWLVKCQNQHIVRVLGVVGDSTKPPVIGETDYVLVTQRRDSLEVDGETKHFSETTVFASDENGEFYNAALYVTPGIAEIWEVMFAIGEI